MAVDYKVFFPLVNMRKYTLRECRETLEILGYKNGAILDPKWVKKNRWQDTHYQILSEDYTTAREHAKDLEKALIELEFVNNGLITHSIQQKAGKSSYKYPVFETNPKKR